MPKKNVVPAKTFKKKYTMQSLFVNIYLLCLFTIFPLILTDQYASARRDKYYTFLIVTAICAVLFLADFISKIIVPNSRRIFINDHINSNLKDLVWLKKLSAVDISALSFLIISILSFAFSEFKRQAFFADVHARNNGLLLILAYTVCYIILSRNFYFSESVLIVFTVTASLICGLGILNFFFQDPFGVFNNYSERYVMDFITTIGNKNIFSSFVAIFLPFVSALFITSKNRFLRVFYLVGTAFAFCGLIVADSDSGYISYTVFMAAVLIYCVRTYQRLKDFFTMTSVMLLAGKILRLISLLYDDKSKNTTAFGRLFIYKRETLILLILTSVLALLMHYYSKRNPELNDRIFSKRPLWIVAAAIMTFVLAIIAVVIYFSFINTSIELPTRVLKYLRFNDAWGTHRGYMWIRTLEIYRSSSIKNMLIGSGPDTLRSVFYPVYGQEMLALYNENTNAVHNEYLQYLITHGILGALSYISIIAFSLYRSFKKAAQNPAVLVFAFAIMGYASQAIVNIAQPITTPYLIVFIAIAENICRTDPSSSLERRL